MKKFKDDMPEKKAKNYLFGIICLIVAGILAVILFSGCGEFEDNQQRQEAIKMELQNPQQPVASSDGNKSVTVAKEEFCENLLKDDIFKNFYPFTAVIFRDSTGTPVDTMVVGRGQAAKFQGLFKKNIAAFEPYTLQKRPDAKDAKGGS